MKELRLEQGGVTTSKLGTEEISTSNLNTFRSSTFVLELDYFVPAVVLPSFGRSESCIRVLFSLFVSVHLLVI